MTTKLQQLGTPSRQQDPFHKQLTICTLEKYMGSGSCQQSDNGLQAMIHPTSTSTSTSPDLLIHPPHGDDGRAGSQNEGWLYDNNLFRAGAAEAAVPPSNAAESLHHTAAVEAETASPLDDFLSGEHHHRYPFGFTISITNEHKISLPAAMPSEYEQKNGEEEEEEWSCDCDESASLVSELTQMTYRAELMKQAIMIEFEKFRQQKKQQGVEAHPEVIKTMFHRTMSCPDIQKSMTSFVTMSSAKMKAEALQHHLLEEVQEEEEHDATTSDPTIQRRVDELFVEFGVRLERPILQHTYEISEENDVRSRPSTEQGAATDHHLDSVIQLKLKLQLAQKQATLDELSSKYNALLVQKSAHPHNMVAENSRLMRENERLRAQLRQAGITTSAAPTGHQFTSSSRDIADSQDRLTPPSPSQPSHTFNIHKVLQDRLTSARVEDSKKVDASNKAYQTPPELQEFKSFGTRSTATDTSSDTNESPPLQASPKPLNSFSNLIQGWRNRPTTTTESPEESLHRSLTMRTMDSTKSSDTCRRRRGNGKEWTSALMLQRRASNK